MNHAIVELFVAVQVAVKRSEWQFFSIIISRRSMEEVQ